MAWAEDASTHQPIGLGVRQRLRLCSGHTTRYHPGHPGHEHEDATLVARIKSAKRCGPPNGSEISLPQQADRVPLGRSGETDEVRARWGEDRRVAGEREFASSEVGDHKR